MDRRRAALGLAASFLAVGLPGRSGAQEDRVLVVSRARILSETGPAQSLRAAETKLRDDLRAWVNERKQSLDEEERALTELRPDLPRDAFDMRSEAFDQRVRAVRRDSQRLEAAIQSAFRDARKELITALYPILIEVLRARGGQVILDQDNILLAAPEIDVTDQVIALYNARVAAPVLPEFDTLIGGSVNTAPVPEGAETQPPGE